MKLFIKPDDIVNIEFRIKEEGSKIVESSNEGISVKVTVKRPNYIEHNNILQASTSVGQDGKANFNLYAYQSARLNTLVKSVVFYGKDGDNVIDETVSGIKINTLNPDVAEIITNKMNELEI